MLQLCERCMGTQYKLDEDLVEKVQRKATKLVPPIRHLPYEERLQCLGLPEPSLMYRRLCGDMIMTYNILHGHLDIDESIFCKILGLLCHRWSPQNGSPLTICGKLCCYGWFPGPSTAAIDGPPRPSVAP